MTGGRPLRFLAIALGGWIVVRIAILLPAVDPRVVSPTMNTFTPPKSSRPIQALTPTQITRSIAPFVSKDAEVAFDPTDRRRAVASARAIMPHVRLARPIRLVPRRLARLPAPRLAPPLAPGRRAVPVPQVERRMASMPFPAARPDDVRRPSRLHASAWLLARGGPGGTLSGGQLGASQAGLRLTYALGSARKVAVAARIAAPLRGRGRETAFGVEWQPTRLPIRLIAEQRFVLDGGRGGPTVGAIAGYGPADIVPGVRIEAYGQAGAIARDGIEGFADGSARVTHPVGHLGDAHIDIGAGLWGSAQRGANRVDIGPSMVVAVPIGSRSIRLALDWRERVAGAARPGSGPAFSIGGDF